MEKKLQVELPQIKKIQTKGNTTKFVIEPLWPGYGITVGNSLRRVLLSSLPGVAAIYVKISGVSHEFSTIPKVKEDVVQIILNLKSLRFKLFEGDDAIVKLDVKGPKKVTAADFKMPSNCEIINKDEFIATLGKGGKLKMELFVDRGMGYVSVEQKTDKTTDVGVIFLDSFYSPIKKVHYEIENTRVGQMTNFDKLTFDITSDGSITPEEALEKAGQILKDHFSMISEARKEMQKVTQKEKKAAELAKTEDIRKTKIQETELSTRTINALEDMGIKTVGGLVKTSQTKLKETKGLGSKSIDEIMDFAKKWKIDLKE